ncbi:hypothetical protein [Garicola koreensis]|uniref:Lipoprotein n=1 Tax=Garicola koreensis TaxID=1262554 RepID=A0A7W5XYN5_9MICC|nr:hypothetical protein [Garicola koreensis]MBB3666681.1 hypothetical protein [Garicola koreensis]
MRAAPLSAVSLAMLVAVSGCSGSQSSPTEDGEGEVQQMRSETSSAASAEASDSSRETAESEDLPTDDDLHVYVEALASNDVAAAEDARSLTVEGSVADAYLTYQAHVAQALIDAGMANMASETVESTDEGFEICLESEPADCSIFADFVGSDGKIQNFTVDGKSLDDRLIVSDGSPVPGDQGAELTPVVAYKAASNETLTVGFDLAAGEAPIMYHNVKYRGPDGRQSDSSNSVGAFDLGADSMASQVEAFPGAEIGGELIIEIGYESTMAPVEITVPIEAE